MTEEAKQEKPWRESRTMMGGIIAALLVVGFVLGASALELDLSLIKETIGWLAGIGIAVLGYNKGGKIAGKVADAMTSRRTAEAVARAESEGE